MPHPDRSLPRSILALALCIFAASAVAQDLAAGKESAASMPDTVAGRCAAAFLDMLRGGGDASVTAFETAWASPKRLARAPIAERLKSVARLRQDMAGIRAKEVLLSEPDEIAILVTRTQGPDLTFEFSFDRQAPGKLDAILISEGARRPKLLTPELRSSTVEEAAKSLEESYVFPDVAAKMAADIRTRLSQGQYDAIKSEAAFARKLSDDLQAVSHDLHLRVVLSPDEGEPMHHGAPGGGSDTYGFRKAEMLDGNVGYLRLDAFSGAPGARETATAALAFLAGSEALVFDLRFNGGGSPELIQFISSWLFDKRTHLNDMVDRTGKTVEEFWTLDEIPGKRFRADVPVYVLTSSRTFSGAEEFSYNLRALERATLVGERTGGGAHPTKMERLNERFVMGVPYMRACNPITKTNWEQKGVEPHIAVAADAALDRAVSEARAVLQARRHAAPASAPAGAVASAVASAESRPFPVMVGDAAPPLRVNRFVKGSPIAEYRKGHAYVVEFWATWCGPCKEGIPHLSELQKKYEGKATVVGISVWEPRDRDVDPFVKDWDARMQYTVAVDEVVGVDTTDEEKRSRQAVEKGLMSKAWLVDSGASDSGIPQAFIVDQAGKVAWMGSPEDLDDPLARVVAGTFDLAAATAGHRKAMELEVFARPLRAKATEARRAGNLEDALAQFDAILARGTTTRDQISRLVLLVRLKRNAEAVAGFEALRPKLKWHEAVNVMSVVAYDGRDLTPEMARAGVAACEAALTTLGKDHTWPLMTMAHLEHRLGRKAEALAAADRALKIARDDDKAEMLEARTKYAAGGGSLKEP